MKRKIPLMLIVIILLQIALPMLTVMWETGMTLISRAEEDTSNITTNYEIKKEETWDVSAAQDGSVIAKWKLEDKSIVISGTGEMKDWSNSSKGDWHNTQYTNLVEKVVIEEEITSIGSRAFKGCSSLKNVTIPEGVTTIEDYAFEECNGLPSITIPSSVTSIGYYTFSGCSSLTSVTIPEGVTTIDDGAFFECSALVSIHVPNTVTNIGIRAFGKCSSLGNIIVDENNKKYIDEDGVLFSKDKKEIIEYPSGKKDLTEYSIPNSVTNIGKKAFEGCSSLRNVTIPEGVTTIEDYAFEECNGLPSITIPSTVTNIGFGAFRECKNLTSVTISEGVTTIDDGAFFECSALVSIHVPNTVTNIGIRAFEECSSLTSVTIPNSVTTIGQYAFLGCSSLTSVTIPNTVTAIGSHALPDAFILYVKADSEGHGYAEGYQERYVLEGEATSITTNYEIKQEETWDVSAAQDGSVIAKWKLEDRSIVISGTGKIKSWNTNSKEDWHDTKYYDLIEKIVIEKGVTNIGSYAFNGCSNLTSVTIPNSVTSIGSYAFNGCSNLTSVTIPNSVTSIGSYAFSGCSSLTSVTIPSSVTSIKGYTFNGCSSLTSVTIPNSVTSIGNAAFRGCSSLTSVTIPDSVTSIENAAFMGCSSLKSVAIPEGIKEINSNTFTDCSSLTSITISSTVYSISANAFNGCSSLSNIIVNENNPHFMDVNGILFSKDSSSLCRYPEGKKDLSVYNIPSGIRGINTYAFYGCSDLTSITIPSSVTRIGGYAFMGCSSLKSVAIPSGETRIEEFAFRGCTNLTSITIPSSVTWIRSGAFYECSSLKNIEIPNSVTSIESEAFGGCTSLENITIPNGVTSIESSAFEGCSSLKNVTIPNGVTNIGSCAFNECSNLKSIIIPDDVTSINENSIDSSTIIYCRSNTQAHKNAEEAQHGYIIDDMSPDINYYPNKGEIPQKKYDLVVNVIDNKYGVGVVEESLKYQWTQSKEEPTEESFTQTFINGATITANLEEGERCLWVLAEDKLGNITIENLDNTAPTCQETYSTTQHTKENVIVVITADEEIKEAGGWILSQDKTTLTKEYNKNIEETITIEDLVGNESQVNVKITNIDKEEPIIGSIEGNPTDWTKENVTLKVNAEDSLSGLATEAYSFDGGATWQAGNTMTFAENTSGIIVKVRDKANNITAYEQEIDITKIDKENPQITSVEGNPANWTKESVTLTVNASDSLSGLATEAYSFDGGTTWQEENSKTYTENTSEIIVQVKDKANNITTYEQEIDITKIIKLTEINLTNGPVKTNYIEDQAFDKTGMVVIATYDNGITEEITDYEISPNRALTTEDNKVIISYTVNGVTKTAEQEIEVAQKSLTEISITTAPSKTEYIEGQVFDKTGMVVTATYDNGTSEEIIDYEISPNGALTTEDNKVIISYTERGITKTAEQEIAVVEKSLTSIQVKTEPSDTRYFVGETLNTEGLILTAIYNDGTTEEITEGYECTPTTLNTVGSQIITVTYEGKTTTFNVTVALKGDANGDSKVDFMDILAVNKHRLGKAQLTGIYLEAADVTGDGNIDFMDILQINKYRLGKINSL